MMHWVLMGVTIALAVAIGISIAPMVGPAVRVVWGVVRVIWLVFWWIVNLLMLGVVCAWVWGWLIDQGFVTNRDQLDGLQRFGIVMAVIVAAIAWRYVEDWYVKWRGPRPPRPPHQSGIMPAWLDNLVEKSEAAQRRRKLQGEDE
jgi:hypothetical protein